MKKPTWSVFSLFLACAAVLACSQVPCAFAADGGTGASLTIAGGICAQDDGDAEHGEVVAQGTCGQNARFTWYADRTVVISPVDEGQPAKVETYGEDWAFDEGGEQLSLASDKAAYQERLAQLESSYSIRTLIIEDGITEIGYMACAFLLNMRTLELPAQMDRIGDYAFAGCTFLSTVTLPERLGEWSGYRAFYNAPIKQATLPLVEDGTGRAADLLGGCRSLRNLSFAEGVTDVVSAPSGGCDFGYAIDAANHLQTITFPSGVVNVKCGMLDPYGVLDRVEFSGGALVLDDPSRNLFSDTYTSRSLTGGGAHATYVSFPYEATGFVIADAGGVASSRVRDILLEPRGKINYLISQVPTDPADVTLSDADAIYAAWREYWDGRYDINPGVSEEERARLGAALDALWEVEMQAAWGGGPPAADDEHGAVITYGLCGQNAKYVWYEDGTLTAEPIVPGQTASVGNINNSGYRWVMVDAETGDRYSYSTDVATYTPFYTYVAHLRHDVPLKTFIACEGITRIERMAFNSNHAGLRRVELPEHLDYIGAAAFANIETLTEAVLPKTISACDGSAFYESSLRSAVFPLMDDGRVYFTGGSMLQSVTYPEGVASVMSAVSGDGSLRNVTFPSTLAQVKAGMFDCKYNLEWVRFKGDYPALDDPAKNLFTDKFIGHTTVYYPYGAQGYSIGRQGAVASNVWTDVTLLAVPDYDAIPDPGDVTLADADMIRSAQAFEANACEEARAWATGDAARLAPAAAALDALELAAAKADAKAELSGLADPADYRPAQQDELSAAVAAGIAAIESAGSLDGVASALEAAKGAVSRVRTDEQMTAAEQAAALRLSTAKADAKAELSAYRDPAGYRSAQQAELAAAVSAGSAAIDAAADTTGVASALSAAKAAVDAVPTDAQLTAAEKAAKEAEEKAAAEKAAKEAEEKAAAEKAAKEKAAKEAAEKAAAEKAAKEAAEEAAKEKAAKEAAKEKAAKEAAEKAAAAKAEADLSNGKASLSAKKLAYTGKGKRVPAVAVKSKSGKKLEAGADFAVTYLNAKGKAVKASSVKAAGAYRVRVTGKGAYTGTRTLAFKVVKAKNTAKVAKTVVKKSLKASKLAKKAAKVALPKVKAKFGKAKWSVSKKDKKKVLSLKSGKLRVKKGAKPGTYTIKLVAKVKGTKNYKPAKTKTVTVKVVVR